MAKDMMRSFSLLQPDSLDNALALADKYAEQGWLMAGGQDSLDWFKDRAKSPEVVIDLGGLDELRGIRATGDGVEIGALTTLTDVVNSELLQNRYSLLCSAAAHVASPQIRNVGTIGGNVAQDARCWYYRAGMDCYRAGGSVCYADTPEGMNREHCLFGANRCVAVSPSDVAPALIALDASMLIRKSGDERVVAAEEFFIGPDVDIERMTVLEPGEVLVAIRIPGTWSGADFYFEKAADRNTWDFALVNIAAAVRMKGDLIDDVRMSCGGVECVPRRLTVVEDVVRGSTRSPETADLAAGSAARGATPLNFNHFKIPLMENLVRRVIRGSS